MRLHSFLELAPVESLVLVHFPSLNVEVVAAICKQSRVVHHLLGDTSNIHASAAESPLASLGCWGDKIGNANFGSVLDRVTRC